jgi:hypothetical protein
MDVMTALAAVSQALDGLNKIREIEKDFDAAALKLEVANLASSLADAKMSLLDIKEDLAKKDSEIKRLIDAAKFQAQLVTYREYQYEADENGKPTGSPFCPVCIQNGAVHIRLTKDARGIRGEGDCPRCKAHFGHLIFNADRQNDVLEAK